MWYVPGWAVGVGVIILAVSLGKMLRQLPMLGERASRGGALDPQLTELREALDAVQKRLGDLEERLDFAERLLARPRAGEPSAPPS
jgi:hypothetical protein